MASHMKFVEEAHHKFIYYIAIISTARMYIIYSEITLACCMKLAAQPILCHFTKYLRP
jgi:hypothetical protein